MKKGGCCVITSTVVAVFVAYKETWCFRGMGEGYEGVPVIRSLI